MSYQFQPSSSILTEILDFPSYTTFQMNTTSHSQ